MDRMSLGKGNPPLSHFGGSGIARYRGENNIKMHLKRLVGKASAGFISLTNMLMNLWIPYNLENFLTVLLLYCFLGS